ncbi:unnamed protein product, partial [marine sediment metagenome]
NGKQNILVRHLLSHTSGLAGIEEPIPSSTWYDWDKITSLLAAQKPWWEPGTKSGYHSATHGFLLGELVRRITGKSLGTFFKEEVADRLKIDFHIGLAEEHVPRVTRLIRDPPIINDIFLFMKAVFNSGNNSEIVKKEIKALDKKVVLDFGDEDQFSVIISNGEIRFTTGKIKNPDCSFITSKDRARTMNWIFSRVQDEPEYVSKYLKMEGKPEDLNRVKELFELIALEARI